jgi:N-methylhydantoinase B
MERDTDPVTFDFVKNALEAICDEMSFTIDRTSYSLIIREQRDDSTALLNVEGEILSQGHSSPFQLGSIMFAARAVLAKFGGNLFPGDVIILNDPYEGGSHLPDLYILKPVFAQGEMIAFTAAEAHHSDIGGRVPGGNAADSTEIYQEGLRIPPAKLYEQGKPNSTLFDLLERNVRVPRVVLGDLRAQLAACYVGEQAFLRLSEKLGREVLLEYSHSVLDYADRLTRMEISTWPAGVYGFTDWIDDDSIDSNPIKIQVKIEVDDGQLIVDFEGSGPASRGGINQPVAFTCASTYLAIRAVMAADIPNNSGFTRPIAVKTPVGSIVHATPPSAVGSRALTGFRVVDAVLGCLAQIVPDRVMAAGEGGTSTLIYSGTDDAGSSWILSEIAAGSWGGRSDRDGLDGISNPCTMAANIPVEVLESEFPLRVTHYGLAKDHCGAGKFRGGLAVVREVEILADQVTLQVRADRAKFLPYGLYGGKSGTPSRNILNAHSEAVILPSKGVFSLHKGDRFMHVLPGAGGFGDPLERDLELIIEDLRNEKISPEYAAANHGVNVDPRTLEPKP